ncbi:MAG TPA: lecithin retinol acyltransferase family protein [Burkholderiaceae bacterium]|nr:lecithin retinol acyltransferase family protein [Burkholderiaceae bacterium]
MDACLVTDAELPIGAHLVTPRGGFTHHGIYAGNGKVIHYAGLCHSFRSGPVEEVSLAGFALGNKIRIEGTLRPCFDRVEIVARARSRLGETRYRLLTNNCEHFCTWCIQGKSRSRQVRCCLARPVRTVRAAITLLRMVFASRAHAPGAAVIAAA